MFQCTVLIIGFTKLIKFYSHHWQVLFHLPITSAYKFSYLVRAYSIISFKSGYGWFGYFKVLQLNDCVSCAHYPTLTSCTMPFWPIAAKNWYNTCLAISMDMWTIHVFQFWYVDSYHYSLMSWILIVFIKSFVTSCRFILRRLFCGLCFPSGQDQQMKNIDGINVELAPCKTI